MVLKFIVNKIKYNQFHWLPCYTGICYEIKPSIKCNSPPLWCLFTSRVFLNHIFYLPLFNRSMGEGREREPSLLKGGLDNFSSFLVGGREFWATTDSAVSRYLLKKSTSIPISNNLVTTVCWCSPPTVWPYSNWAFVHESSKQAP